MVNNESQDIVFHGTLQQLVEKVERGEMVPKLQASHVPCASSLPRSMSLVAFVM